MTDRKAKKPENEPKAVSAFARRSPAGKSPASEPKETPVENSSPAPASESQKNADTPSSAVTGSDVPPTSPPDASPRPQSSNAGGDTIRMRVQPKPKTIGGGPTPLRPRKRLPDIRGRGGDAPARNYSYGPFSIIFGFFLLIFQIIFFSVLALGLGAAIGYVALTAYIGRQEAIVPDVQGMTVSEAVSTLSDKKFGLKVIAYEPSNLVAPGEIISQRPQAGSKAKSGVTINVIECSGRAKFVVPNVIMETEESARNKISGANLEVGNVIYLPDDNVAKGEVASQTPTGDSSFDDPVAVDLMISTGPASQSLTMPDLTNRTLGEARAALRDLGFTDIVVEPAGAPDSASVIEQSPLVGKHTNQSNQVKLTVQP